MRPPYGTGRVTSTTDGKRVCLINSFQITSELMCFSTAELWMCNVYPSRFSALPRHRWMKFMSTFQSSNCAQISVRVAS